MNYCCSSFNISSKQIYFSELKAKEEKKAKEKSKCILFYLYSDKVDFHYLGRWLPFVGSN